MIALISTSNTVFYNHLNKMFATSGGYTTILSMFPETVFDMICEHQPDLVICSHEPPMYDGIALATFLRGKVNIPIIMAAQDWSGKLAKEAVDAGIANFMTMYPNRNELALATVTADARMAHEEMQNKNIADLNRRLSDRRIIEKAKGILMEQKQISEEAAFRLIRESSMKYRITMAFVAAEIINGNIDKILK